MIAKSKRGRYRWIVIEGNLDLLLKQFKTKWKSLNIIRSFYGEKKIHLMVYRELCIFLLRDIYAEFKLKNLNLKEYTIKINHTYKK